MSKYKYRGGKKLIYGVGVNDALESNQKIAVINGKSVEVWHCPFYKMWARILERCYSEKWRHKNPSYKDCRVCDEWLRFSSFKAWASSQKWEGMQIDKDIISMGNKEYSPEKCVFVSKETNSFTTKRESDRGEWPLGVSKRKDTGKFASTIHGGYRKKFAPFVSCDPMEMHRNWQRYKIHRAGELIEKQEDQRVIDGLNRIIKKIQFDYDNNIETKFF